MPCQIIFSSLSTLRTTLSANIIGTSKCSTSFELCDICLNIPDGRESDVYISNFYFKTADNIGDVDHPYSHGESVQDVHF